MHQSKLRGPGLAVRGFQKVDGGVCSQEPFTFHNSRRAESWRKDVGKDDRGIGNNVAITRVTWQI